MFQNVEVVVPELILNEECHHGSNRAQEATGIAYGVERQVADNVGALIVFPHLIARWRKERQQNLILRMVTTQTLHKWPSLFKLTQRSGMKPHISGIRIDFLFEQSDGIAFATPHLANLLTEKACHSYTAEVEINDQVVHKQSLRHYCLSAEWVLRTPVFQ